MGKPTGHSRPFTESSSQNQGSWTGDGSSNEITYQLACSRPITQCIYPLCASMALCLIIHGGSDDNSHHRHGIQYIIHTNTQAQIIFETNQQNSTTGTSTHVVAPKTKQPNNDDDDPRFRFRFPQNQNISTFPHTKARFEQEEGITHGSLSEDPWSPCGTFYCARQGKGREGKRKKTINGACRVSDNSFSTDLAVPVVYV